MIATPRVDTVASSQEQQPRPLVCFEPVLDPCHPGGLSVSVASALAALVLAPIQDLCALRSSVTATSLSTT